MSSPYALFYYVGADYGKERRACQRAASAVIAVLFLTGREARNAQLLIQLPGHLNTVDLGDHSVQIQENPGARPQMPPVGAAVAVR